MAVLVIFQQCCHALQNLTLFNCLSIFSLLAISILFLQKLTKTTTLNLPPSPPKLPIIGNLHQLGTLPHRSLTSLSKKHGPLMLMQLGQTPTLVISSAQMAKEMTKEHDITFSDRHKTTAAKIFAYQCVDIAFAPYGEYWRQLKKLCVLELLSVKRVQSFQHVRDQEVKASVDTIRHACSNGSSVNLTDILLIVTNNIVSRCVLGQRYDGHGEKKLGELARKVMVQFTLFSVGDFFPSLGWLDAVTGLIPKLKDTHNQFDTFFNQVIEEHKVLMNTNKLEKDFVDILLELQMDNMLGFDLTCDNLKAILMIALRSLQDMFVGGTETTSTAVEWTVAELIKNPTALRKVQDEVRKVVGKKSKIEESDINQMGYLKCVMKESLRLHPPLPLLVPRETSAPVKLGGYDIPAKTNVLINSWAIQRDPNQWDMPEEFIPERFDEINSVDFKGQDFEFTPFGSGRRGCPGMSFAVASAEWTLANILHWFDWELPDGMSIEKFDMSESYGITVHKKVPIVLVPVLYSACCPARSISKDFLGFSCCFDRIQTSISYILCVLLF